MEIDQGDNDYQEVDQTEINVPTEISEGKNHDEEVIQRLTSGIREVAKLTAQLLTPEIRIRDGEIHNEEVIQLLSSEIRDQAEKAKSLSSPSIYRVPKELRKVNQSAYTPRLIAIGPLHRNDKHLKTPMQHVKMSYMNNLLCRLTPGMENPELAEQKKLMVLRECMAAMKASLDDAKKCYAEEITLDEKMMLIDGCFILEVLYRFYLFYDGHPEDLDPADPIFGNRLTRITVQHDLLLLENQIPFSVLEQLFKLIVAPIPIPNLPSWNLSLNDLVCLSTVDEMMRPAVPDRSTHRGGAKTSSSPRDCVLCVSRNIKEEEEVSSEDEVSRGKEERYRHVLHRLHETCLPRDQTETVSEVLTEELPSASELVYAGVMFIRGKKDDLFKVTFTEPTGLFWWYQKARFEIPYLLIDDSTEAVLRNLIAFEQCCPGISQHFTSYAKLMDMLVNYDKDVQLLEKAGVVRNSLGATKDATDLFNNLCKEVPYGEFLFADTCNKAIRYRKRIWPKNIAHVRRKYFASPVTFIAFCLGFIAFGVTITKFIRSFLA